MKALKHILSWTIWGLVALHAGLFVLLKLPQAQAWIGQRVAAAMSARLGTQATVGRVELSPFSRVIVDDVVVPDLRGDTLLRIGRLSVKADLLPLLQGRISISSAQLFGAHARLCQEDSAAVPNYQFLVDALSADSDTTATPMPDLHIGSLIVRHSSLSYDRGDITDTPGSLNLGHISIDSLSTHITLKSLTHDTLGIHLKRLSLRERSGLAVKDLSARLTAGRNAAQLRGLRLRLPHSTIAVDTLDATTAATHPEAPVLDFNVQRYRVALGSTTVCLADLAPLVAISGIGCQPQALASLPDLQISGSATGTAKTLTDASLSILAPDGSLTLEATAPEVSASGWHIRLDRLDASSSLIATLKDAFPVVPDKLTRLGSVRLSVSAIRQKGGHTGVQAAIATTLGDAALLFANDGQGRLSGHLTTDSLHLGRLLANDDLGAIAATITLSGTEQRPEAAATVQRLQFRGHSYRNVLASGMYLRDEDILSASLAIDDPGLKATAEGTILLSSLRGGRLKAAVDRLCPAALGLSGKWGDAVFSATADADITATTLSDAQGHVSLSDFTMRTPSDSLLCHISHLTLTSSTDGDRQRVELTSDIGEGELTGRIDLSTLPATLARYVASRLPTLPGLQQDIAQLARGGRTANDFYLRLAVSDTRWMQPLLGTPLRLHQPLQLIATVDDEANTIDMTTRLPSFTYSGNRYRDLHLSISTQGDSTLCAAKLTKMNSDGGNLAIGASLKAANNNLSTSLTWNATPDLGVDTLRTTKGIINTIAQLYTNHLGQPEAHVTIKPSQVLVGDKPWLIRPSGLTYSDGHLDVDSFSISHAGQHLIVNGIASQSSADTLTADIVGLDIAYIQDLLDFHPVDFAGQLSGKAHGTAVLGDFTAQADITVPDFRFMEGRMGTLMAQARWNTAEKQIDIDAVADESGADSHRTIIKGFVSPVRSDIDLSIRAEGSNIEFCHTFTKSVFSEVSGQAHGQLRLSGPLGQMSLTGLLIADGQITVDALNTTYRLENDTVHFVHNDIQLRDAVVTDRDGHSATLSGGIHHQWLSDFTFDLDVVSQGALVFDFPTFGDSNICGTVRADGHADIHARPGEVVINCDVTPLSGSSFAYNAANPDAVSGQEFITWETSRRESEEGRGKNFASSAADDGTLPPLAPQPSPQGSDLHINFLINTTPDATLRVLMDQNTGDYITLNGEGTIRATFHDKGPFSMFGTYTVGRGTYGITIQNIIKKNFTFQNGGTIVFGGDPYDATLALQAVHTVNGVSLSDLNMGSSFASNTVRVNCLMNISGTPAKPQVDFDLEMPTVNSEEQQMIRSLIASEQEMNQQVLYLLGIGRFYTQGANNADAQQYGQTTLAMQSFLSGTVSTQINEVLSQVIKSNDWNFGANISTGNEGWNNAEYEGMVSGRLLDNRLLINGQFGYRDNATTAKPSFIGDFDLQYLLKRNGNLAVKVYNQTNDRYFTRSSLNTQGVGLVMKKDFDGLGDLLTRKKKKEKHSNASPTR